MSRCEPHDVKVASLAALPTATISDALDKLRLPGSALGIGPLQNGLRIAGRAFTVRYVPAGATPGTVGDYIDEVGPGDVVVLDNQGRADCTVWGDILTAVAHERGVEGTVISGVCRDVELALELGYPIFSSGRFMRTGKDRAEVADTNLPIALGVVRVAPNDIIIADDDGVVVVPAGYEDEVVTAAEAIEAGEQRILADARRRGSLAAARREHGYHTLQRGDTP